MILFGGSLTGFWSSVSTAVFAQAFYTDPTGLNDATGLNTRVDFLETDPTLEFRAMIDAGQWELAAEILVKLRDQKTTSLVFVRNNADGNTCRFIDYYRFLNFVANEMLSRHSELRNAWQKKISLRLESQFEQYASEAIANKRSSNQLRRLTALADRYAFAKGTGTKLVLMAAAENAAAGNLADASRLLSIFDTRFERFQVRFGNRLPLVYLERSELDSAEIRIPQIAARLVLQEKLRCPQLQRGDMEWFQSEFKGSVGQLGNQTGDLVSLLAEQIELTGSQPQASFQQEFEAWTTSFGKDNSQQPIEAVIANKKVVWKDRHRIYAAALDTGLPCFPVMPASSNSNYQTNQAKISIDAFAIWQGLRRPLETKTNSELNFPPIVLGEQVFAVFPDNESNLIVGLDLGRQGRLLPRFPIRSIDSKWRFESPPIVRDGLLYVLAGKYSAGYKQVETYLQCYPLQMNEGQAPMTPVWSIRISTSLISKTLIERKPPIVAGQLAMIDRQIVFCTGTGAIGAIDFVTGRINWLIKYLRNDYSVQSTRNNKSLMYQSREPRRRAGEVPMAGSESLYVIPQDSPNVFAINRYSGSLVWQSKIPTSTQMIDVSKNTLLLGGDQLIWLDQKTGRVVARIPDLLPNTLPGMRKSPDRIVGRPALVEDRVWSWINDSVFTVPRVVKSDDNKTSVPVTRQYMIPDSILSSDSGGRLIAKDGMILITSSRSIHAIPLDAATMKPKQNERTPK